MTYPYPPSLYLHHYHPSTSTGIKWEDTIRLQGHPLAPDRKFNYLNNHPSLPIPQSLPSSSHINHRH